MAVSNLGLPILPDHTSPIAQSLARQTLYGLFAFFVVLPAVFGPQERSLVRRSLQVRPIALIGVVSYGVYLWHEAWIDEYIHWSRHPLFHMSFLLMILTVTALAVAAASVSYAFVERPVRLLRSRQLKTGFAFAKQPIRMLEAHRQIASPEPSTASPAAAAATDALAVKA